MFGWLIVAIAIAFRARAFRRRSIVGPQRLAPRDSAWMLVMAMLGGAVLAIAAGALATGRLHVSEDAQPLALTSVMYGVFVPVVLFYISQFLQGGLRAFGLGPRGIIGGVGVGALTLFVIYPLVALTSELTVTAIRWLHLRQPQAHPILQSLAKWHDPGMLTLAAFAAVVAAPVAEELVFRGVIQTSLTRLFGGESNSSAIGRWAAVLITAAAFAASHMQMEVAFLPPLFVLAVAFGYVYERTGNLWATIAAHAMFNSLQIAVFLAMEAK
jgi:membrane protease YdiL (CAAX protease family)